jgi:hypothetical protein
MEIRSFVKEAKKQGWKDLSTVAVGVHHERAAEVARKISRKRSVRKRGITIQVFAAENLLSNPRLHGGGIGGERIATEYRKRFEIMKESESYKELEEHEERARYIEKWHLTRLADLASFVWRPRVMSDRA